MKINIHKSLASYKFPHNRTDPTCAEARSFRNFIAIRIKFVKKHINLAGRVMQYVQNDPWYGDTVDDAQFRVTAEESSRFRNNY
jgi:hypothetical protein